MQASGLGHWQNAGKEAVLPGVGMTCRVPTRLIEKVDYFLELSILCQKLFVLFLPLTDVVR